MRSFIRHIFLTTLFPLWLICAPLASALDAATPGQQSHEVKWTDAIRDVFIDDRIDYDAQVIFSELTRMLAIISPRLDRAVVLDMKDESVGFALKDSFHFSPDRNKATSAELQLEPGGKYTVVEETTFIFRVAGLSMRVSRHQGPAGHLSIDRMFEVAPVWRSLMEHYRPNPAAVAAIKGTNRKTTVIVAVGTWCPDSKYHVPRLLKAIAEANNKNITVKLVGIANKFKAPPDVIARLKITKVPTVIVERRGVEIGRITENPVAATIEEDLAAILRGEGVKR
jgi:hypothetical protein